MIGITNRLIEERSKVQSETQGRRWCIQKYLASLGATLADIEQWDLPKDTVVRYINAWAATANSVRVIIYNASATSPAYTMMAFIGWLNANNATLCESVFIPMGPKISLQFYNSNASTAATHIVMVVGLESLQSQAVPRLEK